MLVLVRKKSEFITLRDKATGRVLGRIGVCEVKRQMTREHDKVRLGFELDDSIEILRDELLDGWRGRGPVPDSEPLNGRTSLDGQRAAG